ncbi:MAG: hypothetical protein NTY66_04350 [Candidatus Vogelbacteria bacterium]|nr:hypothetical protein [Candidatus Vogelbacteria bacterium]
MINEIQKTILANIQNGSDTYLVGPTDSGKTWFVEHELIPFLQNEGLAVRYFENANKITPDIKFSEDVVIMDETEILVDKSFREGLHPAERPFYSPDYLDKVATWHKVFKNISQPAVFIITRNKPEEIDHLIQTIRQNEWNGKPARAIEFVRNF